MPYYLHYLTTMMTTFYTNSESSGRIHVSIDLKCFWFSLLPPPRDKLNNLVLFDKNTYDKLYKEVPTYKLITPSIVSERLKVCGQK